MSAPTEYAKATRISNMVMQGVLALGLIGALLAVCALTYEYAESITDVVATVIATVVGALATNLGSVIKNLSTIVDYIFGGSDKPPGADA